MNQDQVLVEIQTGNIFVLKANFFTNDNNGTLLWWYRWGNGKALSSANTCPLVGCSVVVDVIDGQKEIYRVAGIDPNTLIVSLEGHGGYCNLDNILVTHTPGGARITRGISWYPWLALQTCG